MTAWADLTWPEVAEAVADAPFALLPFGAVEEHGPHLPLGTDCVAADALADRLADRASLLRLPTMPYGQVWSLEHFPGSLSVSDETLVAVVVDIARGLRRVGVRGLVLLTAHLGNAAALKKATRLLEGPDGLPAIALAYPGLKEIAAQVRETPESHPAIMHSDELETSVILAIAPERVRMERAVAEYPQYPRHFDVSPVRWDTICSSGVFGDATAATAEKGELIVEHVVSAAAELVAAWREGISP